MRLALAILLIAAGCHDYRADAPHPAAVTAIADATGDCPTPTIMLRVDTVASVVRWRGTKLAGRGKHEGIVRLAGGTLVLCDGMIWGGRFTLDMRSIAVTDIPSHEPVPRARLQNHLLSDDFFAAETYPTATFEITRAVPLSSDSLRLQGTLTMRGVSQGIAFIAHAPAASGDRLRATAQFTIDRQRWGVAFRGAELTNDLVDDEIALDIQLSAIR